MYNYNTYYPNYNNQFQQPSYNQNMMGKQEVVRVNGKNGAEAFQMLPNSSILLLDETAPIIWLKTTDGAGYPTIKPYDISPHQDEMQKQVVDVEIKLLEDRISKLEEIIKDVQFTESNVGSTQPTKRVVASSTK